MWCGKRSVNDVNHHSLWGLFPGPGDPGIYQVCLISPIPRLVPKGEPFTNSCCDAGLVEQSTIPLKNRLI